jgi:NADH-quinone oxidoreductase subunit H
MTLPIADTRFIETTGVWIAKSLVIIVVIFAIVPILTLVERKLIGRFQNRYGPNRVGPYGLLQPLADVLKLLGKEQSHPQTAAPLLMTLAPVIIITTAVASLDINPF